MFLTGQKHYSPIGVKSMKYFAGRSGYQTTQKLVYNENIILMILDVTLHRLPPLRVPYSQYWVASANVLLKLLYL